MALEGPAFDVGAKQGAPRSQHRRLLPVVGAWGDAHLQVQATVEDVHDGGRKFFTAPIEVDNSPRAVGDYDMLIFDRGFATEPQGYHFDAYHSSRIPTEANPTGGNYFRWVNPKVDAALELAGSSFDTQARKDAYCEVGQAVLDDMPQIYLYLFQDNYGIADSLTVYTLNTWCSMSWGSQNWQLK